MFSLSALQQSLATLQQDVNALRLNAGVIRRQGATNMNRMNRAC